MKYLAAVLLTWFAAFPVFATELMTVNRTPVLAEPTKAAKVLGHVERNVVVQSDRRKDYWFHVTVKVDEQTVTGWVYQTDVQNMMGRSKGQLLGENKRLYDDLIELRKRNKELTGRLRETQDTLKKVGAERDELKRDLDTARRELAELKAASGKR